MSVQEQTLLRHQVLRAAARSAPAAAECRAAIAAA